ncbi:MAG: glutathione S-transferase family protein [Geminicoccaceae bacterium]
MATLYTFAASHFCEKARWALDLAGVTYRETVWAPGPHLLSTRLMAPKTIVPIWRQGRTTVQGSDAILDWVEKHARPSWDKPQTDAEQNDIKNLEGRAGEGIGPEVRRLFYACTLPNEPDQVIDRLTDDAIWLHRTGARMMWPKTKDLMAKAMRCSAKDLDDANSAVEAELDYFDGRLSDGRRYWLGDRLTRADIVLASLLSPLASPPEHPVYGGTPTLSSFRPIVEANRDRPSIKWTAKLYRDFRNRRPNDEVRPAA